MIRKIALCGKEYILPPPTASTFRQIAQMTGVPVAELSERPMWIITAWVALAADIGLGEAADLLVDAGEDFGPAVQVMTDTINSLNGKVMRRGGRMPYKIKRAFFKGE